MSGSLGSTYAIATGEPATEDETGYDALTWVTVGNVATISEIGDTHGDVTPPADLATGRQKHCVGVVDGGEIAFTVHTEDYTDTGQDAVRAANGTLPNFSHRITDPDGNEQFFYGVVVNYRSVEKSAESYEGCSFAVRSNSAVVTVEA